MACAPQPILFGNRPGRRDSQAQSGPIAGRGTPANQWERICCSAERGIWVFPAKLSC